MTLDRPLTICAVGESTLLSVRNRVRCFAERGHRVTLLTESAVGLSGVSEVVPGSRLSLPKLRVLGALAAHRRALHAINPDVVHVHYAHRIPAWMVGLLAPHPLVVSTMGGDVLFAERGDVSPLREGLTRHLLGVADLITAKSSYLAEILRRQESLASKTIRMTWGIDRTVFQPTNPAKLRKELMLGPRDPVVLSPRSLRPLYNVHLLVEALPRVLKQCPTATLVVLEFNPDPVYARNLHRRVAELGLEKSVRFRPQQDQAAMPAYYGLADVVASIPVSDGLPLSLIEALTCTSGACLLSRLASYDEIVAHTESAYLVDLDARAIAEGIILLLSNEVLRTRLRAGGSRAAAREPDFADEISRLESEYYRLVACAKPRRVRSLARAGGSLLGLVWQGRPRAAGRRRGEHSPTGLRQCRRP